MREFLSLLDGAMPYVVLLPTGQLNPDIPDECRELIEYVRFLVVARAKEPVPAETYKKEFRGDFRDEPAEEPLQGGSLSIVMMDNVAAAEMAGDPAHFEESTAKVVQPSPEVALDPDLFTGEDE